MIRRAISLAATLALTPWHRTEPAHIAAARAVQPVDHFALWRAEYDSRAWRAEYEASRRESAT